MGRGRILLVKEFTSSSRFCFHLVSWSWLFCQRNSASHRHHWLTLFVLAGGGVSSRSDGGDRGNGDWDTDDWALSTPNLDVTGEREEQSYVLLGDSSIEIVFTVWRKGVMLGKGSNRKNKFDLNSLLSGPFHLKFSQFLHTKKGKPYSWIRRKNTVQHCQVSNEGILISSWFESFVEFVAIQTKLLPQKAQI